MISLRLTHRISHSQICGVCQQARDDERARQATLEVILCGQEPFATCPCCHQKVASFRDPEYQKRARTYYEEGDAEMNADASTAPKVMKDDVWLDLDPRRKNREIKILAVHAVPSNYAQVQDVTGSGPITKIRLDRFKSSRGGEGKKGFKLLKRPPVKPINQPGSSVVQMQHIDGPHDLQAD
jgi:hypothetical protein